MLEFSWDGEWYRRGYYDDGTPLGSMHSAEGKIDSIAQSWAVLSGAVPPSFAERAMDAVRTHLVQSRVADVLLLTPPFDRGEHDPGYIKAYLPGVRENGGQYTHAAIWVVMASARLGNGDEAVELFHMLNPGQPDADGARGSSATRPSRTSSPATCTPTVLTPAVPAGRGTPARPDGCIAPASRAFSACGGAASVFEIDPCIPSNWSDYSISWRIGATRYEISIVESATPLPGHRRSHARRRSGRSARRSHSRGRRDAHAAYRARRSEARRAACRRSRKARARVEPLRPFSGPRVSAVGVLKQAHL